MRIQQFIKSLNNTEIGKGGTHECYVLVSKKVNNIEPFFDKNNLQPVFKNLKNGGEVKSIHITTGREFRINGLGDFYRLNNVNAGDEIILERQDSHDKTEFFINLNTKADSIIFQKNTKGFEVLNSDRLNQLLSNKECEIEVKYKKQLGVLKIEYKESSHKRSDSPNETDFYSLSFNDINILSNLKSNENLELTNSTTHKTLKKVTVWQFFEFNLE